MNIWYICLSFRGEGDLTSSNNSQSDGSKHDTSEGNSSSNSDVAANTDCSDGGSDHDDADIDPGQPNHDEGDMHLGQPNPVQFGQVSSSPDSSNASQKSESVVAASQQSTGAIDIKSAHASQLDVSHHSILYSFDEDEISPDNHDATISDEGYDKLSQPQTTTNDITPLAALSQPNTSAYADRVSTPPGGHSTPPGGHPTGSASGLMPQSWSQVDPGVLEKLPPDIRRGNLELERFF